MRLPTMNATTWMPPKITAACHQDGNCSNANSAGTIDPTVTPIIGMKHSRNKRMVQNQALSRPTANITAADTPAIINPVTVWTQT